MASTGMKIAIDKFNMRVAFAVYSRNVSTVRDFVAASSAGEIPPGSQVLTEYGRSFQEVLSMLASLSALLEKDGDSYVRALNEMIRQDDILAGKLGMVSSLESAVAGIAAAVAAGMSSGSK